MTVVGGFLDFAYSSRSQATLPTRVDFYSKYFSCLKRHEGVTFHSSVTNENVHGLAWEAESFS